MPPHLIVPENWPKPSGYTPAVLARGDSLFLAGQIGWDADQRLVSGLVAQVEQALRNIVVILTSASARPEDLVRLVWYLVDCEQYLTQQREIGCVYQQIIGRHFPAMTVVEVRRLLEPAALVEIEATAILKR